MDEESIWKMVQDQIGYDFKDINLLKQAFVRRSYTEENGGENNEVLEFIGDKALDFVIVRLLIEKYGHWKSEEHRRPTDPCDEKDQYQHGKNSQDKYIATAFRCDMDEGDLTVLKSKMVEKKTLAHRTQELGLARHLIMGKSDVRNNIDQEPSVKEDLFEAIIGAVAIDSGWNQEDIRDVIEVMLEPYTFFEEESEPDYVRLVKKWAKDEDGSMPLYKYGKITNENNSPLTFDGISQNLSSEYDISKIKFYCELKPGDLVPCFRGFGITKSEAKTAACKTAYRYLKENHMVTGIREEIDEPGRGMAINQLETLARRGYFSIPTYDFREEHDADGDPVWYCECHIPEKEVFYWEKASSKKEAKKGAAFRMLQYVLSEDQ